MKRDLGALSDGSYDLAVVGGGVYGICAAREAALRGLSVALLEKDDFAAQTSSNSLKIVHGGLRYLQHFDLPRALEGIAERAHWLRLAPHLVRPLRFVVPTYGHGLRGREILAAGLLANDLLCLAHAASGGRRPLLPRGRTVSRDAVLALCPDLEREGLSGGAVWYDAQTYNTERLLFALLAEAVREGAQVANRAEVCGLLQREGRVVGVKARDAETGGAFEVRARAVLNTAGPWVDAFLGAAGVEAKTRCFQPSKAINLVTQPVVAEDAIGIWGGREFHDRDALIDKGARLFFAVPWHGLSMIGTRHVPYDGEPGDFRVTEEDVDEFLTEINAARAVRQLGRDDVIAVYGGMLPRAPGSSGPEVALQKRFQLIDHAAQGLEGLLSVVGVKWTAARAVAERAVDRVAAGLDGTRGRPAAPERLAEGSIEDVDAFLAEESRKRPESVDAESMTHVLQSYGLGHTRVLAPLSGDSSLGRRLHPGSPVIAAEILHGVRHEMARSLEDVVRRRTELGLARPLRTDALRAAAELMAAELDWDAARVEREVELTLRSLESLPGGF